jgi:hypothetical protein
MAKSNKEAAEHFHRFEEMMKQIISVPKSEIDKREAAWKKERAQLKARKKKT